MERKYVMTAVGPDSPGIVARMSGLLTEQGFNLEDSRMAVLGGEFAVILLVSSTAQKGPSLPDLVSDLETLTGMSITARETAGAAGGKAGLPFLVRGYAMDHPGIVHTLAQEVAELGANIEEMETTTRPAPVTGTPLFDVRMRISLPFDVSITDLRRRMIEAGGRRNIDVSVEPIHA
jgi:glycine cleavage system transcriptional repressor